MRRTTSPKAAAVAALLPLLGAGLAALAPEARAAQPFTSRAAPSSRRSTSRRTIIASGPTIAALFGR